MSITPLGAGVAVLLVTTSIALAQDPADMKAFPPAESGMSRHVITLPEEPNEENLRVELLPGKALEVDCNRVMISAEATTKTVDGWGYDFVAIDKVSEPATTMMACPDDSKEERFVTINLGTEAMRRYNSKLPLVIYTPDDIAVKYRIWRADDEFLDAKVE